MKRFTVLFPASNAKKNQLLKWILIPFIAYYLSRRVSYFLMMVSRFVTILSHWGRLYLERLKDISIPFLLLSALPYASYLLFYSFNQHIRHITHLEDVSEPNLIILARIEHTLFFCYPHRLLSSLVNPFFDVVAAIPYLVHFPLPFVFALYLAVSEKQKAMYPFLWCMGWVNFMAVIVQITCPTAPPWFVDTAVIDQHKEVVYESPNEAGFSRIDSMFGLQIFHNLYSTSPLKFGAFPSLHVALPMVIFLNHPWMGKKFGAFHVVLITLSALYITHHYLIDALGGILLACIVRLGMLKLWSPFPEYQKKKTDLSANETV